MAERSIGVIATVGEDRGLTPDERRERARLALWKAVLHAAQGRLERIEARLAKESSVPLRASLELKAEAQRLEIARAEQELSDESGDPPN